MKVKKVRRLITIEGAQVRVLERKILTIICQPEQHEKNICTKVKL